MSLKDNLAKLMLRHGNMSVSDLAKATHVPQPTLHQLYSGSTTRPHRKTLITLADYFGITISQLCGVENLPNNLPKQLKHQLNLSTTPILTWDDIPLWPDQIDLDSKPELIIDMQDHSHTFALAMNDTSMEPLFPMGSLLIFDGRKSATDRDCALLYLNDAKCFVFKRILTDAGLLYAKSMNPERTDIPMIKLTPDDRVIGVLLEARIKFF